MFFCLQEVLFSLVLQFGRDSNRRVKSKLTVWYIEKETLEHFNLLIKVFKWIVLPVSLLYVFIAFFFLGVNPIDSVFVGLLIFIYSNFLPDLPTVFCKQKTMERSDSLPWYKKYALLLFAPLIVWLVVSHIPIKWKTTETFHNFKSLTIYAMFLTLFGFLVFGDLPISIGDLIESLFLSLYGIIGYVTHLRVDKIW